MGADLVSVFCAEEAAIPIKCYSPELMVLPIYSDKDSNEADITAMEMDPLHIQSTANIVVQAMERLHVLIIGPGLGSKYLK